MVILLAERITSGIYGLDELIGGGFRKRTIVIINGGIGVGKTTFGLQYALAGLNQGEKAIFLSFEMEQKQIIADSKELGLEEIEEHIEKGNLKIIQLFAEDMILPRIDIVDYIRKSLDDDEHIRIIIDPLTHFSMYLEEEEKEKRKQISSIFQDLRLLGTSIITLEESLLNG